VDTRWWRDKRWSFGWRMLLNGDERHIVCPVVGAALTLGKSYASGVREGSTYLEYNNQSRPWEAIPYFARKSEESDLSPGLKAEFGFMIRAMPDLDLVLMAQVQSCSTSFPSYTEDQETLPMPMGDEWVIVPSLHIGVRYVFTSLSIGK